MLLAPITANELTQVAYTVANTNGKESFLSHRKKSPAVVLDFFLAISAITSGINVNKNIIVITIFILSIS